MDDFIDSRIFNQIYEAYADLLIKNKQILRTYMKNHVIQKILINQTI